MDHRSDVSEYWEIRNRELGEWRKILPEITKRELSIHEKRYRSLYQREF
jgi:hypothetical protein